tara:strand:+ start:558 stop:818 length:261 start_codon:yes stop_codon:yes gene_type:complete
MTNKQDNIILNSLINNIIEFILKHKKKIIVLGIIIIAPFLFIITMLCLYKFLSLFIKESCVILFVQLFIVMIWGMLYSIFKQIEYL